MLYAVIVASEIAFWSLLVGGLYVRYAHDRPRAGAAMLLAAASTDLVVLFVAGARPGGRRRRPDLARLRRPGRRLLRRLRAPPRRDRRPLRPAPPRPARWPSAPRAPKAVRERAGWYRHARMWALGVAAARRRLPARGPDEGDALAAAAGIWTAILVIDFVVSFSYSVAGAGSSERQLRLGKAARGRRGGLSPRRLAL